jgi:hypothetical protein
LIENEAANEHSVFNQAQFYLQVEPVEHYISERQIIRIFPDPNNPKSNDDIEEMRTKMRLERATELREACLKSFNRLFPDSKGEGKLSGPSKSLKDLAYQMSEELNGLRHLFAHKHQELVTKKYQNEYESLNVVKFENLIAKVFKIFADIALVFKQASYSSDSPIDFEKNIKDQLDLIVFGSINSMCARFYKVAEAKDFYWQAREKFFASDALLSILAED